MKPAPAWSSWRPASPIPSTPPATRPSNSSAPPRAWPKCARPVGWRTPRSLLEECETVGEADAGREVVWRAGHLDDRADGRGLGQPVIADIEGGVPAFAEVAGEGHLHAGVSPAAAGFVHCVDEGAARRLHRRDAEIGVEIGPVAIADARADRGAPDLAGTHKIKGAVAHPALIAEDAAPSLHATAQPVGRP